MVQNPGMETHIHPFKVVSSNKENRSPLYLHTSPEFEMKQTLARCPDFSNIYTITYCFRDEPKSPIHRSQFLMLEWYRKNETYKKIMNDVENLVHSFQQAMELESKKFERMTIQEIFLEFAQFDILEFNNASDLRDKISKDLKTVPLPEQDCHFDDYFFLIFLNLIEPKLVNYPYLILDEYPAPLAALSTIKKEDPRVCERFECYINGVEVANCFNECTDFNEIKKRFLDQAKEKKELYQYSLPEPKQFLDMMKEGYPKSAGIALGVERFIGSLLKIETPFFR